MSQITIGTRGSALALWQADHVKKLLERAHPGLEVKLKIIKTKGDKILTASLAVIGGKGVFTKELETALLRKEIDLAVHSLKDLPTTLPKGLAIGAVPKREDVRDAFVSAKHKSIDALPDGATVATGSLRRRAQLLHRRPDLNIVDIRGNLQTRFEKLKASTWDGMILAHAGLKRLKLRDKIAQVIPTSVMLPAVGQGALGIEIRANDARLKRLLRPLHHAPTFAAVRAERALLAGLGGGCQVPIGAKTSTTNDGNVRLTGFVAELDGSTMLTATETGPIASAEKIGARLAKRLLASGAREILERVDAEAAKRIK